MNRKTEGALSLIAAADVEQLCGTKTGEGRKGKSGSRRLLLLFCCLLTAEINEYEPAFVRFMDCVAPLHELDEALEYVCLQWTTSDSREEYHDVWRE